MLLHFMEGGRWAGIIMFHIIENIQVRLSKSQSSRVLFLLPIGRSQIVTITDDSLLTLHRLSDGGVLKQVILPHHPRKAIVITDTSVGLLIPDMQAIIEVRLDKGNI